MIRKLIESDREKIKCILESTDNFNEDEINIAMELINIYINDENQKDYEIFVDEEEKVIRGYVCIGPRPLTTGTYDLYWIAVNPDVQAWEDLMWRFQKPLKEAKEGEKWLLMNKIFQL